MPNPREMPPVLRALPYADGEPASREIDEKTYGRYFAPFLDYKMRVQAQGPDEIPNLSRYYELIDQAAKDGAPPPYYYDKDGVPHINPKAIEFDKDGLPIAPTKQ